MDFFLYSICNETLKPLFELEKSGYMSFKEETFFLVLVLKMNDEFQDKVIPVKCSIC